MNKAHLLFKFGFEDGVCIDKNLLEYSEDYRIIRGNNYSGYFWPITFLGLKIVGYIILVMKIKKRFFQE